MKKNEIKEKVLMSTKNVQKLKKGLSLSVNLGYLGILLFTVFASLTLAQTPTWLPLGPKNMNQAHCGIVISVMESPSNPGVIYAGTRGGGLWKVFTTVQATCLIGLTCPTTSINMQEVLVQFW